MKGTVVNLVSIQVETKTVTVMKSLTGIAMKSLIEKIDFATRFDFGMTYRVKALIDLVVAVEGTPLNL